MVINRIKVSIFFLAFLFINLNIYAFTAPWMLQHNVEYILPYGDNSLETVNILDGQGKILEVLSKTDNGFTISGYNKLKFQVEKTELGKKIIYAPDDLRVNHYIIDIESKFLYYDLNGSIYLRRSLLNDYELANNDSLVNKNFVKIRDGMNIIMDDNKKNYYYYPLERAKFSSYIEFTNEKDYTESPYFGLEFANYEVIEEYKLRGKIVLDEPTYTPYVKNIHTEKSVDNILIVTDEIYDIGGVCFRRSTHFKNGRIVKKVFNKYPENLNPENPDRKKYYDDEVEPYLYDIYQKHKDFDRNNIVINYYYEGDEVK